LPESRKEETQFTSAVYVHKPASQLQRTAFFTRLITQRLANEWFEGLFIPIGLQMSCQQTSVCVIITFRLLFSRTITPLFSQLVITRLSTEVFAISVPHARYSRALRNWQAMKCNENVVIFSGARQRIVT
jgi:hypothetical protein